MTGQRLHRDHDHVARLPVERILLEDRVASIVPVTAWPYCSGMRS